MISSATPGTAARIRSRAADGARSASRTASRIALSITTSTGSSVIFGSTDASRAHPSGPNRILAQVASVPSGTTSTAVGGDGQRHWFVAQGDIGQGGDRPVGRSR